MSDNRLTIIVLARDQTIRMAELTFGFMNKYWKNRKAELVLCTQKEAPKKSRYDHVIYAGENASWSERMKQAAGYIKTKYILFTLEDFFINEYIDDAAINRYLDTLDSNDDVSVIRLFPTAFFAERFDDNYDYVRKGKPYRICGHPAIYRREYFMALAAKEFSPWQYEIEGSEYSISLPGEILIAKDGAYHCIHAWGRGSWTRDAISLFKKDEVDKAFYENDPVYPTTRYFVDFVWSIGIRLFPGFFINYSRKKNRQD